MTQPPLGDRDELSVQLRKGEHLDVTVSEDVDGPEGPGWADIRLLHEPLPEVDVDDIDLGVPFLGSTLAAPLVIAGMTGGHERAGRLNEILASAAERHGLAIGVGSQRAALIDTTLTHTYSVVRSAAPTAFILGNLGAAQLIDQSSGPALTIGQINAAVEMVEANALAIHLNFLEEVVQVEGDRRASGCLAAIRRVTSELDVPVVAKETGGGMDRGTAERLSAVGVEAVDVGGSGGTSFVAVEAIRASQLGHVDRWKLGNTLTDWGIPTAVSVLAAAPVGVPVIATGGVRTGADAAKAMALGASLVGVGRPLIQAAHEGEEAVDEWIDQFLEELRVVCFLSGCRSVGDLRGRPVVLTGATRQWAAQLGYLPPEIG